METQYNVVFEGKTAPGKDRDSVKEALIALLKTDARSIERLFSGKPISIRKNVDAATAGKFRRAFEAAGAVCSLRPVAAPVEGEVSDHRGEAETHGKVPHKPPVTPVPARSARHADGKEIIITNVETVPGKTIVEHFGLVSGSTIRAKHFGRDIMASLKNLVGGELKGYTQLLNESRKQAMDRMIEQARHLGANAIVNIRFSTSSVAQGAAELYAYGTAIRIE